MLVRFTLAHHLLRIKYLHRTCDLILSIANKFQQHSRLVFGHLLDHPERGHLVADPDFVARVVLPELTGEGTSGNSDGLVASLRPLTEVLLDGFAVRGIEVEFHLHGLLASPLENHSMRLEV